MPKRPDQPEPQAAVPASEPPTRAQTARPTRPFRFGSEDRVDPDPALRSGELVGERYRIVRLLGEGGMGRVYEAEHTVLRRRVALKLLRRDAQAKPENLARFQQEALAASRIRTAQIVDVVDFANHVGPCGQQTYMVMELLAGESFEAWLDHEGRLDHALELLAQLCEGLAAAHRAGVIHRDIKPANVFCCAPGPHLKILDFGIAKITEGGQGFQTQEGSLLGTPYYLAPERVTGDQLTPAADIYSVGVILYELLTGNVPFTADSFVGILAGHVYTEPLDPRQAAPDRLIPDAVAALCMRLLDKDPARRPNAAALALELRAMLVAEPQALAAARTGPRDDVSSAGADTQVLPEAEAGQSMSERSTAPPSMQAPVLALESSLVSGSRRRGGTSIGHSAASTSSAVRPAGELSWAAQARAPVSVQAPTGRRWVIVVAAALLVAGSGVAAFVIVGAARDPEPDPPQAAGARDPTPAVEPATATTPTNPATTATSSVEAREPREVSPELQPVAPAQAQPEPEPIPENSPAPAPALAPKKSPKKSPNKAKAKPDPVEPEPPPPDPAPIKPDLAPPDAKPDPDLPTIKDDVYD